MIIDPTSHAGRMIEAVSSLQFSGLASIIFILGMLLLVGAIIFFTSGKQEKHFCPKPGCASTNVIALTKDGTGHQPYQCMSCGHIHRVDPLQPRRDLAETIRAN